MMGVGEQHQARAVGDPPGPVRPRRSKDRRRSQLLSAASAVPSEYIRASIDAKTWQGLTATRAGQRRSRTLPGRSGRRRPRRPRTDTPRAEDVHRQDRRHAERDREPADRRHRLAEYGHPRLEQEVIERHVDVQPDALISSAQGNFAVCQEDASSYQRLRSVR